jgi:hypothetical protein
VELVEKFLWAEGAGVHSSVTTVLRTLFLHSAMRDQISDNDKSTLVWTSGESIMSDSYEDVCLAMSNRIFSASTQFPEPQRNIEGFDKDTAVAYLKKFDETFEDCTSPISAVASKSLLRRGTELLKQQWIEYMLIDLYSYVQRARLRTIVETPLSSTELRRKE